MVTFSKKKFLDTLMGRVCTRFQVYIIFRLARERETDRQMEVEGHTYLYASENKNIPYRLVTLVF